MFLFLIGIFSDFLDGYLARKLNAVSNIGKILDATVDKVFFFGLLICFIYEGTFSLKWLWALLAIHCIRDVGVTYIRMILTKKDIYLGASSMGKFKTVLQFVFLFLGMCLVLLESYIAQSAYGLEAWIDFIKLSAYLIYIVSIILCSVSGIAYLNLYLKHQNNHES
jgi:CDP-diacylglycerol--glycerol-3-phosphate 3-phosphatidyltransferase